MCGRFTLSTPGEVVAEAMGLDFVPELKPRYNIAPTQPVAVVRPEGESRRLLDLRWGLVPLAWKAPFKGPLLLNARAETLRARSAFRGAFETRRCLVPADGFYEWQSVVGEKKRRPHLIRMGASSLFAMAGLFEPAHPEDPSSPGTCAIVTTRPNALLSPIHDRMPVILAPEDYAAWLDPRTPIKDLELLFLPFPADRMTAVRVGPAVNNAQNDSPECVKPLQEGGASF